MSISNEVVKRGGGNVFRNVNGYEGYGGDPKRADGRFHVNLED